MEKEQDMSNDFVDILMGMHRQQVEAMVYLQREAKSLSRHPAPLQEDSRSDETTRAHPAPSP